MTKKLLALLLAALTVFTLSACSDKDKDGNKDNGLNNYKQEEVTLTSVEATIVFADGQEGKATLHFESLDSDTVAITGYKGPDQLHTLTIPTTVQTGADAATSTKRVAAIGDVAFYSVSALVSVIVPEGIASIGEYAFAKCVQMESISLPSSLKTIEEGAFLGSGIKTLPIPESCGVTEIAANAFAECPNLTEVTIPAFIQTVRRGAFKDCTGITKVVISEGVTTLEKQAFQDTTALASLTLPASLTFKDAEGNDIEPDPLEDLVFSGSDVLYIENITCPAGSAAEAYVAKMNLKEQPVTPDVTE